MIFVLSERRAQAYDEYLAAKLPGTPVFASTLPLLPEFIRTALKGHNPGAGRAYQKTGREADTLHRGE
jgi:hypothetical protein